MGYKSKNLKSSRNKSLIEKSDTQSDLLNAISNINTAQREKKKLDEMIVEDKKDDKIMRYYSYANKQKKDDEETAKLDYDAFKKRYDNLISSDRYKDSIDNSFPNFDEFYNNRAKAKIGGVEMSASDLQTGDFDIEKLNMIISLMGDR